DPGHPGPIVGLAHGVTCNSYERIKWSGHLILLDGDILMMQALDGVAGGKLQFEIVLIPITLVRKAEIEAEKEWLP
ncbi:unnamed protein product, partial [marine sediment metagenome]